MSSLTANFQFDLPELNSKSAWGVSLNNNWTKVDQILGALKRRNLVFEIDPQGTTDTNSWVLGFLSAASGSVLLDSGTDVDPIPVNGQGRLVINVPSVGGSLTGSATITAASRSLGTGATIDPDSEVIPIDGEDSYVSNKNWRLTGTDHASKIETSDLDFSGTYQILSIFDNDGKPFDLRKVAIWATSLVSGATLSVEAYKVEVVDYVLTTTELILGRLDLSETTLLPGTYHDFLSINEAINPCAGEGLLLVVIFNDPGDWKKVRIHVGLDEDPV